MGEQKIIILIADNIYANYSGDLRFDGETPLPTNLRDWKQVNGYSLIEEKQKDTYVNLGWKLKAGFTPSNLLPEVLTEEPDEDIIGLYSVDYEVTPGSWVEIRPVIEVIKESEGFRLEKPQFQFNHFLLDKIKYSQPELINKPAWISSEELYRIVRSSIKQRIDGRYARVTSDYDFCLTVEKRIEYREPIAYTSNLGTEKRPKYVTKHHTHAGIKIFQAAPKPYQSYPVMESMSANNYMELEKKIRDYVEDLIEKINKPLKECPNCGGTGACL